MFEVQISEENIIKSVMAWSALNRQMCNDGGLLGLSSVTGLQVIVKDEAEMLAAGLYPWIEQFDAETLTYTVNDEASVTNVTMLKLLMMFERAVTYGVLRYLCGSGSNEGGIFSERRSDAMGAIRTALRANCSTPMRPCRW